MRVIRIFHFIGFKLKGYVCGMYRNVLKYVDRSQIRTILAEGQSQPLPLELTYSPCLIRLKISKHLVPEKNT